MNIPDHNRIVNVRQMSLETSIPMTEIEHALSAPPEHVTSEDIRARESESFNEAFQWWGKRFGAKDEEIFLWRLLELAQNTDELITLYRCTKKDTPVRFATICAVAKFFTEKKGGL